MLSPQRVLGSIVQTESRLGTLSRVISSCTKCGLCRTRTRAVPGEGADHPEVLFIGEGPGYHEDQQGRPFVGAAGKFLEEMLRSAGLSRSEVFITNVVKCRPPNNRDPLPEEIEACVPYLDEQIAALNPMVIVTLGRFSMARFFPDERISRIHGISRVLDSRTVVPLYHPAAALHQQTLRATLEADFRKLPGIIAEARERRSEGSREAGDSSAREPSVEQLRLF
ncbi:MAG: uracil-DNA glycosylase [Chloroflexi bacterium]|nr:uracil-DNA glycosylase [Chloroflexota bacterium]